MSAPLIGVRPGPATRYRCGERAGQVKAEGDEYEWRATKRQPWVVRAERRAAGKRQRAARKKARR